MTARAPRPFNQDRLEQLLHALNAIAREGPSEVLRTFGREIARLLLQLSRSLTESHARRRALVAALERLAAAEAAYRRAHDQSPSDAEIERRWREMARAGDAARAAVALESLSAAGLPIPKETSHA